MRGRAWTGLPRKAQIRRMKRRPDRQLRIEGRPALPRWESLPAECREEVLRLLVQLMQAPVHAVDETMAKEAGDE
jgi:hypothetical protein